jgi:hypothetical protein
LSRGLQLSADPFAHFQPTWCSSLIQAASSVPVLQNAGILHGMRNEHALSVTVGPVDQRWLDEVSPWLKNGDASAIVLLPHRIAHEMAIYSDDVGPLVKWLQSEGFDAIFLDMPDQAFESQYNAVSYVIINILLNMAGGAVWDGFKSLLGKMQSRARDTKDTSVEPQCKMSLGLRKPDGSVVWQGISGPTEEVLKHAESLAREYLAASAKAANMEIENIDPDPSPPDIPG